MAVVLLAVLAALNPAPMTFDQAPVQVGPTQAHRATRAVKADARETGVPAQTVRDWLRSGRLRGRDLNAGTGKRARWRVFASEAERDRRGATP